MTTVYIPVIDIAYEGSYPVDALGYMLHPGEGSSEALVTYRTKRAAKNAAERGARRYRHYDVSADVWPARVAL